MMFKPTFFLLLIIQISFSQESTTSDSICGVVKYDFIKPNWTGNTWKPKSYKSELQFNSSASLFIYNKLSMLDNQAIQAEYSKEGFAYKTISADEKGFQYFRNFKTNKIFFRVPKITPLDPLSVEDDWLEIDWKVKKKNKNILGYNCTKAVGQFRGRTYEAWFTDKIPAPYGPWKLFGLPGLILEIKDINNQIEFIATDVCYPCKTNIPIEKKLESKHMNIQEYIEYKDYIMENAEKKIKNTLDSLKRVNKIDSSIEIDLDEPTTEKDIENKRKFMLEIIFEWEDKRNKPVLIKSREIKD